MDRPFTVIIERDSESRWLVGSLVELPEVRSQARDLQSLEANMREAIAVYLDAASLDE